MTSKWHQLSQLQPNSKDLGGELDFHGMLWIVYKKKSFAQDL